MQIDVGPSKGDTGAAVFRFGEQRLVDVDAAAFETLDRGRHVDSPGVVGASVLEVNGLGLIGFQVGDPVPEGQLVRWEHAPQGTGVGEDQLASIHKRQLSWIAILKLTCISLNKYRAY